MFSINTSVVSGVAISEMDGEWRILLLKRTKEEFWCHVAGSIESGELAWQAIIREFVEETAIKINKLYSAETSEQFYDALKDQYMIIPSFVVICNPNQKIELNSEHTEFRWCSLSEALELVPYPGQKELYLHVWKYFVENHPSDLMKVKIS